MNGPLALALLALGPLKAGLGQPPFRGLPPPVGRPTTASAPTNDARDPIASLAQEWLLKR